jgi:hypothetical protein
MRGTKMWMIMFFVLLGVVALFTVVTLPRNLKDIQRKRETVNAYAIQNVETGKCIRVHDAGIDDGRRIVLYPHQNWECITWQFIKLEGDIYLLKNLYTQKSFQPSSSPETGVTLWQQPLGGDRLQYWEFIKQPDETYLIRLKDTDLYIKITSNRNGSDLILMPLQNTTQQQWVLIEQRPIF